MTKSSHHLQFGNMDIIKAIKAIKVKFGKIPSHEKIPSSQDDLIKDNEFMDVIDNYMMHYTTSERRRVLPIPLEQQLPIPRRGRPRPTKREVVGTNDVVMM